MPILTKQRGTHRKAQIMPESTGSTTIEFEATSQDNPLSNDPDPTNNTTTLQLTQS